MRFMERILIVAINEGAINTVSEIMNGFISDYIEGYQDWAGEIFNRYFPKLSREMQTKIIHTCVFEAFANKLARAYDIAEPWRKVGEFRWEYKGFESNPHMNKEVHLNK